MGCPVGGPFFWKKHAALGGKNNGKALIMRSFF
jgi:hypothetical protein